MTDDLDMQPIKDILQEFPDHIRHQIIVDSNDWEKIIPALFSLGGNFETGVLKMESFFIILRVFMECVYMMGYNRGKKEKMLNFIVAEDQNDKEE